MDEYKNREKSFEITLIAVVLGGLIFYTQFYQYVYGEIPGVATFLGGAVIGIAFFCIYDRSINLYTFWGKEVGEYFFFWAVVFFTGAIGSIGDAGVTHHVKQWVSYFLYFLLIPSMMFLIVEKRDIYLFAKLYSAFALLCALKLILNPVVFYETAVKSDVRYSIARTCNVNQLGMYFSLGTWCILLLMTSKPKLRIPGVVYILIMLYANNMTQSRKNLIAISLCVGLWFILVWFKDHKRQSVYILFLIPILIIGVYTIYTKLYLGTNIQLRMMDLFERLKTGDTTRIKMYENAMIMLREHPLLGFGIGGFGERYGGYSHATYAELPACTGIVGCVLYLGMYIKSVIRVITMIKKSGEDEQLAEINMLLRMALILWILIIFMSASIIYFYELICFITFGILFSTIRYSEWCINNTLNDEQ